MKKIIFILICMFSIITISSISEARGRHFGMSFGGSHSVRTHYSRGRGIVMRHLAGNPRSGIHCRNNFCA
jgi:hypothetical protein